MKRIIMLVFILLLSCCITKENKLEDVVVVEEVKDAVVEVTDIQTTNQQLDVDDLKLIDLDYDTYDLRAKDNDLELVDYYQNNYLFAVYDTNSMSQSLPTLQSIFKTEDKEYAIEDISINNGIIKDEQSFYHFARENSKTITLYRYDVKNREDQYLDNFEMDSIFYAPLFLRDNQGTVYFFHINNQTESFDIYKEKDNQFEKIHSIILDNEGTVHFDKELFHIIDNILYYVRDSKENHKILAVDLNTKEEKLIYQLNRENVTSSSFTILNNTIAISLVKRDSITTSELYLVQNNQEKLLLKTEEYYYKLRLLDEHTILFASADENGFYLNSYSLNTNARNRIKHDDAYFHDAFSIYDKQINIGFYRQQRYYKLDIDDLIH